MQSLQAGHLGTAWRTPAGPEIEQHDLASIQRQQVWLTADILQLKVGRLRSLAEHVQAPSRGNGRSQHHQPRKTRNNEVLEYIPLNQKSYHGPIQPRIASRNNVVPKCSFKPIQFSGESAPADTGSCSHMKNMYIVSPDYHQRDMRPQPNLGRSGGSQSLQG